MTLNKSPKNNSYKEIMDRIEVTDEMRSRILENVVLSQEKKHFPFQRFSRYLPVCASLLILAIGASTLPQMVNRITNPTPIEGVGGAPGTASIETCKSINELSRRMGFKVFGLYDFPFEVKSTEYTSYFDELAQITYRGADNEISYRQSARGDETDNSGDYNEYPDVITTELSGLPLILKGENGNYVLAIWYDNDFCYSISTEVGLKRAEIEHLVEQIATEVTEESGK